MLAVKQRQHAQPTNRQFSASNITECLQGVSAGLSGEGGENKVGETLSLAL